MVSTPAISVVMPVYQSCIYLEDAIKSILEQTFDDFEFLIIVDESTSSTKLIIDNYAKMDNRIFVYYQKNRLGLIGSLNYGCKLAKGKYIARMDADDVCINRRLKIQYDFLEEHPNIGIVGSWVDYIDQNDKKINELRLPILPNVIQWYLHFGNFIAHPTVMMRRSVIDSVNYYSNEAVCAEDYDLWVRASGSMGIANIPEVLLKYRIHEGSVCSSLSDIQEQTVIKVSHRAIMGLCGKDIPIEVIKNLRNTVKYEPLVDNRQAELVEELILSTYGIYKKQHALSDIESKDIAIFTGKLLFKLSIKNRKLPISKRIKFLSEAFRLYPLLILYIRSNRY
jgi:glycosyltransferase involved in cell wall biosynthesis